MSKLNVDHSHVSIGHEYSGSFTPRRFLHRNGKKPERLFKRKKLVRYGLIFSAIGCILFTGIVISKNDDLPFQKKHNVERSSSVARDSELRDPIIEEGDEENSTEGKQFIIRNVDRIMVELRAVKGESTLFMGKVGEEKVILRQGDKKVIEGDDLSFRLGKPSNVDIFVNNKPIITRAQDQEKSYHLLKKLS